MRENVKGTVICLAGDDGASGGNDGDHDSAGVLNGPGLPESSDGDGGSRDVSGDNDVTGVGIPGDLSPLSDEDEADLVGNWENEMRNNDRGFEGNERKIR